MKTAIGYHPVTLEHLQGISHPERPERISYTLKYLQQSAIWENLIKLQVAPAPEEMLKLVHPERYIRKIQHAAQNAPLYLDPDTPVTEHSYSAALNAVGVLLSCCDFVLNANEKSSAFALIRPPGHHAESNRAMGFCLFNNIAIAARYIMTKYNVHSVAILDWDVHHGNGTQAIFYSDPTVLYISLHQFPFYPGTGSEEECGDGPGYGYTLNIPLPAGSGGEAYRQAFEEKVIPKLHKVQPDILLISAGYDAHRLDPLASMLLEEKDFAWMTTRVLEFATSNTEFGIVFALEGGYNLEALARSIYATLQTAIDF